MFAHGGAVGTDRVRSGVPFAVVGAACVVAGGLLAAAVAHRPSEHVVWAAAYLVLVAGVAQMVVGASHAYLENAVPGRLRAAELIGWNLGNAAVIAGTVSEVTVVTDIGGALLFATLVLLLRNTQDALKGWWLLGYRLVLGLVAASIPVGLVIAQLRAG